MARRGNRRTSPGLVSRATVRLARELRALEKGSGRQLTGDELMIVFNAWYRLSQPFLDPNKARDALCRIHSSLRLSPCLGRKVGRRNM